MLEARDRVGGRVEAGCNGMGERIDTGGQFVCDDMPEVMALAKAHGKTFIRTRFDGEFVSLPRQPQQAAAEVYGGGTAMRERMNAIEPGDPDIAGLSVAAWLARQRDPAGAKAAFRSMIEGLWCLPLDQVPLWYLISNDRRITNEVPELQYFLGETMQSLAADLARELGDRVRPGEPVTRIEHGDGGVRVHAAGKAIVEARAVIVALPPVMASRLDFSPDLPVSVMTALDAWRSGAVIKIRLRYARPFWRDKGLSGMVMWRDVTGLFACDTSEDDAHAALTFFIGGPLALDWSEWTEEELRAEVLARLVAGLGDEAAAALDFSVRNWTGDRWSGGAYSDIIVDMEATDAEDVLRAGVPSVRFASSELSPSFPGYVEGAIVAGREAAKKVMAELARDFG